MSPEEELLVGVFPLDDAEVDEAGQEGNDLGAREVGAAHDLIEGERLILQHFEYLLHSISIGHHRSPGVIVRRCGIDVRHLLVEVAFTATDVADALQVLLKIWANRQKYWSFNKF